MAARSNRLIAIGAGIFIVSALGIFLLLSSGNDAAQPQPAAPAPTSTNAPTSRPTAAPTLRVAPGRPAGFEIPSGYEAVEVTLRGAPAVSGYAVQNDVVNVYATFKSDPDRGAFARLLVRGVRVLDVMTPPPGTDGDTVYLLALTTRDAERVIFGAKFESLWITLARPDQGEGSTRGRDYDNTF